MEELLWSGKLGCNSYKLQIGDCKRDIVMMPLLLCKNKRTNIYIYIYTRSPLSSYPEHLVSVVDSPVIPI